MLEDRQLRALEGHDEFIARHVGPTSDDQSHMLSALGLGSLEELTDRVVPSSIRWDKPLELGAPTSEVDTLARLRALADRNERFESLIGMGYYDSHTPKVILRNVLEN